MRIAILASGSKGNAALIEHGSNLILLDCGVSLRRLSLSMNVLGTSLADLKAICITHEHGDHVKGLKQLVARTGLIPYMTQGTALKLGLNNQDYQQLRAYESVQICPEISATPYVIPHDAREPVQYVFSAGSSKVGFATDIGSLLPRVTSSLTGCETLVVECNYDPTMLENNLHYPRSVKQRIRGEYGHLSNEEGAQLVAQLSDTLRCVVAAHISDNNNTEDLVLHNLKTALQRKKVAPRLLAIGQNTSSDWLELVGG